MCPKRRLVIDRALYLLWVFGSGDCGDNGVHGVLFIVAVRGGVLATGAHSCGLRALLCHAVLRGVSGGAERGALRHFQVWPRVHHRVLRHHCHGCECGHDGQLWKPGYLQTIPGGGVHGLSYTLWVIATIHWPYWPTTKCLSPAFGSQMEEFIEHDTPAASHG